MSSDPYSIEKMMNREPTLRECHPSTDPYHDFFSKDPIHHLMDSHMHASSMGGSKKLYDSSESTSFQCTSQSLFDPVNVLLYDMPPMRTYPSSSRSEHDGNVGSQLPGVFAIQTTTTTTTYLPPHSPIDYLSNDYSPPPQDPPYPSKLSSQHYSPQSKSKKRIPAVPCHSNSICANCKTTETTLWRRAKTGEIECNACNLYFRKNNTKRPMSLCKDTIMKRNRKPRVDSSSSKQCSQSS